MGGFDFQLHFSQSPYFPEIGTMVTKHFSSIVPWLPFEGWLLKYDGWLLIFR